MPFHKPRKLETVKFDASERHDFVKNFSGKKKKVDKKKQARERFKKEKLEARRERRNARPPKDSDDDLDMSDPQEVKKTNTFTSACTADPFGDVTVTTTTWE